MCRLESEKLQFTNTFSANKVVILCSVDLLQYGCETVLLGTIQVTEDRKYFPQGPHVGLLSFIGRNE